MVGNVRLLFIPLYVPAITQSAYWLRCDLKDSGFEFLLA